MTPKFHQEDIIKLCVNFIAPEEQVKLSPEEVSSSNFQQERLDWQKVMKTLILFKSRELKNFRTIKEHQNVITNEP